MQMRPAHNCLETARQEQAEPRGHAAGPLSQGRGGGGGGSEEQVRSQEGRAGQGHRALPSGEAYRLWGEHRPGRQGSWDHLSSSTIL